LRDSIAVDRSVCGSVVLSLCPSVCLSVRIFQNASSPAVLVLLYGMSKTVRTASGSRLYDVSSHVMKSAVLKISNEDTCIYEGDTLGFGVFWSKRHARMHGIFVFVFVFIAQPIVS